VGRLLSPREFLTSQFYPQIWVKNLKMKCLLTRISRLFRSTLTDSSKPDDSQGEHYLDHLLRLGLLSEHSTIFDVGAYNGDTSHLYLSRCGKGRIYAFEPSPTQYELLSGRFEGITSLIPINAALSDVSGRAVLNLSAFAPTNSLLQANRNANKIWGDGVFNSAGQIEVEAITLDTFVSRHSIKSIDLLKLDVQGAELRVLEGARKTIESDCIHSIFVEVTNQAAYSHQPSFWEVMGTISQLGYMLHSFHDIDSDSLGYIRQFDCLFISKRFRDFSEI
jgi:FkbM family methyltransferase